MDSPCRIGNNTNSNKRLQRAMPLSRGVGCLCSLPGYILEPNSARQQERVSLRKNYQALRSVLHLESWTFLGSGLPSVVEPGR